MSQASDKAAPSWRDWLAEPVSEVDDDEYDAFVSASPQGSIYCRKWWLDAVAPGRYRILARREGGNLVAAWPVVYAFADPGRRDLVMPKLTQTLGVLMRPPQRKPAEELSFQHRTMSELLDRLPPFGYFYQKMHPALENWLPFYWAGFSQTTLYTYVIGDISDKQQVWSGLRTHVRQNIRKAEKAGVEVHEESSLDALLDLNRRSFARQGMVSPIGADFLTSLDQASRRHAGRLVLVARDAEGQAQAGVYVVHDDDTAYYLVGGADAEQRSSGAQILALWRAVERMSGIVKRFDFEGSMFPAIEAVFRGFGAVQVPYSAIRKSTQEPWMSWGSLLAQAGGKLRRGVTSRLVKKASPEDQ